MQETQRRLRRSIRLKGYDYSRAGAYFVTVCTNARQSLFGKIEDGRMKPNLIGDEVQQIWSNLPSRFPSIELDAFVVMPNHIHGIVTIVENGVVVPAEEGAASSAPTVGDIMRVFKSISAIHVNRILSRTGRPLWQRNYYEHVIRDEKELNRVRQYTVDNPAKWALDRENPDATGMEPEQPWLR